MKLSLREMRLRSAIEPAVIEAFAKAQGSPPEFGQLLARMITAGIIAYRRAETGVDPEKRAAETEAQKEVG